METDAHLELRSSVPSHSADPFLALDLEPHFEDETGSGLKEYSPPPPRRVNSGELGNLVRRHFECSQALFQNKAEESYYDSLAAVHF